MGSFSTVLKVVLGIAVVAGGGLGAAYYTGMVGNSGGGLEKPSVTVTDMGDWGAVTQEKIELVHTLGVQNPNPVRLQVGDSTKLDITLRLNGVRLGSVQKTGLDIQQGNNSVRVRSELQQDRVAEFWSAFINRGETIHANVSVTLQVNTGPGFSVSTPPIRVTALSDKRPVSAALDSAGNGMEGTYSKEVSTDNLSETYLPETLSATSPSRTVSAAYTVEKVDFEWGKVTPKETTLKIHLRVRNTGDIILPTVFDGAAVDILLNDIEVFHARREAIAPKNVDGDSVIRPGEVKSYTLVATAENQRVEEWFTTYAKRGEQSHVRAELEFYADLGDASISLPEDGALAYECRFETGIFVDNQTSSTTCGKNKTVHVGPTQIDVSDSSSSQSDATTTRTESEQTRTETATSAPPTARLQANPTEGEVPLTVSFDASGSADPNGDIQRYIWKFGDGTSPDQGTTTSHTFRVAGTYEVTLVVIDSEGNRDTETVTITAERALG